MSNPDSMHNLQNEILLPYQQYDNLIQDDFIELIMSKIKIHSFELSKIYNTTTSNNENNDTIRNSKTISIKFDQTNENEIFNHITNIVYKINKINSSNNSNTNFVTTDYVNNLDIIQYSPGEYFNKHQDYVSLHSNIFKQYALIICIEEPKEGGDTILFLNNDKTHTFKNQKYSGLLFRNEIWHEANKVLSGKKIIVKIDLLGHYVSCPSKFIHIRFPDTDKEIIINQDLLDLYPNNYFFTYVEFNKANFITISTHTYEQISLVTNLILNKLTILDYELNRDLFDYFGVKNQVWDDIINRAIEKYMQQLIKIRDFELGYGLNKFEFDNKIKLNDVNYLIFEKRIDKYLYYNELITHNYIKNLIPIQIYTSRKYMDHDQVDKSSFDKIPPSIILITIFDSVPIAYNEHFIKILEYHWGTLFSLNYPHKKEYSWKEFDSKKYVDCELNYDKLTWINGENLNTLGSVKLTKKDFFNNIPVPYFYNFCSTSLNKVITDMCKLLINIAQYDREEDGQPCILIDIDLNIDDDDTNYKLKQINVNELISKLQNSDLSNIIIGEEHKQKRFYKIEDEDFYWCNYNHYYSVMADCYLGFVSI